MILFFLQTSTRAYEHSGFILRLILEGDKITFEPPFDDFEVVLLNVYDVIVKASVVVPRVETKLYSEWVIENFVIFHQWAIDPRIKSIILFDFKYKMTLFY